MATPAPGLARRLVDQQRGGTLAAVQSKAEQSVILSAVPSDQLLSAVTKLVNRQLLQSSQAAATIAVDLPAPSTTLAPELPKQANLISPDQLTPPLRPANDANASDAPPAGYGVHESVPLDQSQAVAKSQAKKKRKKKKGQQSNSPATAGEPNTSHRTNVALCAVTSGALDHSQPEMFVPPANFAMVAPFVYRSSFPSPKNFPFLLKLGLKSILTLVLEDYPEPNLSFLRDHNIRLFQFRVPGNKEPFIDIPQDAICSALTVLLDKRNHPVLIHCNKGKHRTGCLVGCLRKLQHWSHSAIFNEYRLYSYPKSRHLDQQFIELFDISQIWPRVDREFLPNWPTLF
ncbi:tyrosine-protein phosphatase siw14 [Dimargaris verticillata]|uniref:diphosphoinositol-polyphosphate diphosphatase n=1 Tax=Dimargaris verticillata TaxID=2761393 RepID=A0A9W8B3Q4_9FUNG|nr:tyrosine-protein phosphatase siw14 [Dimargaris verticillata]